MPSIDDVLYATGVPSNIEAESHCLGSAISYPETIADVLSGLSPEDFSVEANRRIYLSIKQLYEAGLAIDVVLLCNRLFLNGWLESVGGVTKVSDLTDIPKIVNLADWIGVVKEKSRLRRLMRIGQGIVDGVIVSSGTSAEIISGAVKQLSDEVFDSKAGAQSIKEFVDEVGPTVILDPSIIDAGLPSGFTRLDEFTGGFHAGEIHIVGARPRLGKSVYLANICRYVAEQGKHVLFFSLEMRKKQVIERMLCGDSSVGIQRLRAGYASAEERDKLRRSMESIYDLPFSIDDTSGLRVSELGMRLRAIHQKKPVSLCAIDFLQLLRSTSRGNENEQTSQVCNDLQQLAKSTGIPLLIASQLNRESEYRKTKGESRKPQLSQLRNSGAVEQIANVVVLLHREWLLEQKDISLRDKAEFILAKNRDGEEATIDMGFMGWKFRFENLP
jgi:replicative DNA helicase